MPNLLSVLDKLANGIEKVSHGHGTGTLVVSGSPRPPTELHFFYGRLLYATNGFHRVRSWHRGVQQHCPDWNPTCGNQPVHEPWEYGLLHEGTAQKQLRVSQAKSVIRNSIKEGLFSLAVCDEISGHWHPKKTSSSDITLSVPLSLVEVEQVFEKTRQLQEEWIKLGLQDLDVNLAPVLDPYAIAKASAELTTEQFSRLKRLITGDKTLWDIAAMLRKPVTKVTQILIPYANKGILEFQPLPDLPLPCLTQPKTNSTSIPKPVKTVGKKVEKAAIACIDDNPTVCRFLENVLTKAGYRVLKINDPLRATFELAKYKPDLIFMDLLMPEADGYSLCTFLRKSPVFENIPIIILTARNGLIDRTRAKLAGATDFLTKPPEPQTLLDMIHKYVNVY